MSDTYRAVMTIKSVPCNDEQELQVNGKRFVMHNYRYSVVACDIAPAKHSYSLDDLGMAWANLGSAWIRSKENGSK
jgi:hypothetical protein